MGVVVGVSGRDRKDQEGVGTTTGETNLIWRFGDPVPDRKKEKLVLQIVVRCVPGLR